MHDERPCCAADALRRIRLVLVSGRPGVIAMLDPYIAGVRAEDPGSDTGIQAALMQGITRYTSVPKSVEEEFRPHPPERIQKIHPKT